MSDLYCILVGAQHPAHRDAREAILKEAGLEPVFAQERVRVFATRGMLYTMLAEGRGIVIGRLFARTGPARAPELLTGATGDADTARWLIARTWGRYVAVLTDPSSPKVGVLRDPTGLMACYGASKDGLTAFAPEARILKRLGLISGAIDWPTLALPLAFPDLRLDRTALVGVSEPVPGDVIHLEDGRIATQVVWRPTDFCHDEPEHDFEGAARAVRSTVDRVLSDWGSGGERILLSLSGGLDSSIIATGIIDSASRLAAFNLRSGRGRGDERDYARAVAQQIGIELEEADISRSPIDLHLSLAADLPNASARCFTQPVDRLATTLADRTGATLHMNGGGGDNVFAFLHSANPAADRLCAEGLGRGFATTVSDLAELTHCTLPYVAWRAIGRAWWRPNQYRWPQVTDLLTADYLHSLSRPHHPWLADQERLRPGQREHVAVIARALFFTGHLNIRDRRPTIYPLLSQPLVELCLSIPTWFCCRDGRDRAVARAAFIDRLPQVITDRRSKGAFDSVLGTIYEHNRTLIRQMILDGGLVRNGILCRDAAERALDTRFSAGHEASRLLQCVDIEAWAAAWGA